MNWSLLLVKQALDPANVARAAFSAVDRFRRASPVPEFKTIKGVPHKVVTIKPLKPGGQEVIKRTPLHTEREQIAEQLEIIPALRPFRAVNAVGDLIGSIHPPSDMAKRMQDAFREEQQLFSNLLYKRRRI